MMMMMANPIWCHKRRTANNYLLLERRLLGLRTCNSRRQLGYQYKTIDWLISGILRMSRHREPSRPERHRAHRQWFWFGVASQILVKDRVPDPGRGFRSVFFLFWRRVCVWGLTRMSDVLWVYDVSSGANRSTGEWETKRLSMAACGGTNSFRAI